MAVLPFVLSAVVTVIVARALIPRLMRAGIVGPDMHKSTLERIPEMGGIATAAGFAAGTSFVIGAASFFRLFPDVNTIHLLASLAAVLMAGLIGMVDDLLGLHKGIKAFLPVLAAIPLMAVRAGHASIAIPLIGKLDLWVFYPLLVIPSGFTVAANGVNMLAGFNGLEAGLGIVVMSSLAVIAGFRGEFTALIILLAGAGALLGVLRLNWFPASLFLGDVGTLSIGAIIASAVIVGDMEVAGLILLIPYGVDFLIKALHGFPKTFGELRGGKLHCPSEGPKGLGQLIMKITRGIHERSLVLLLIGLEAVLGLVAISLYVFR